MKLVKLFKLSLVSLVLAVVTLGTFGVRAAEKQATAKVYPLDKCIVSDEKLGDMGKPYVFTHEGQEVKLCCKSCLKDFKKEPAKYLKKLETASQADKK
jgi:YHS domain-containing protein